MFFTFIDVIYTKYMSQKLKVNTLKHFFYFFLNLLQKYQESRTPARNNFCKLVSKTGVKF